MTRMETIGRGVLVIGILAGVAALVVIFGRGIFEEPPADAPSTEFLTPMLTHANVLFEREREDLSERSAARTVLLSVPEASDSEAAVGPMLRLLRSAGWLVSGRGGAISQDGTVCMAVTTPDSWLGDSANSEFRDEFEKEMGETDNAVVLVDLFFCSDAPQP